MNLQAQREELVRRGRELASEGIVARTWGNMSMRCGSAMLITPSGIPWEELTPADMVEVDLVTLAWAGNVKPSSEKELHATVYRIQPDTGALVHTHQNFASAWAAARKDLPVPPGDRRRLLGSLVPCAPYALPTTRPLARAVGALLERQPARAVLLANHGALCMGPDTASAMDAARALEDLSRERLASMAGGMPSTVPAPLPGLPADTDPLTSTLCTRGLICETGDVAWREDGSIVIPVLAPQGGRHMLSPDVLLAATGSEPEGESIAPLAPGNLPFLHSLCQSGVNRVMVHSRGPFTLLASARGKEIRPVLDDLAQICGTKVAVTRPGKDLALRGVDKAVLVPGQGALILARDPYEALALALVLEKSCLASHVSRITGSRHPISHPEALLMRFIYLAKYGKTAKTRHGGTP